MTTRARVLLTSLVAALAFGIGAPAWAGDAPAPSGTPRQVTNIIGEWRSERIKVVQTVTFEEDGTVHGNAGCNTFSGTYKQKSWFITISPLATTLKFCDDATMHAEQKFLAKLQSAKRVDYNPDCGPAGLVFDTKLGYLWVRTTVKPDPNLPPLACTGNARPFSNARP